MSIEIIYKEKNEELFNKYWNDIISESSPSPRYLPINLKTILLMSKNKSLFYQDKSFIYLVNNKPLAGVFFPIEKNGDDLTGSAMGDYIDAPIFLDISVEKKVFGIIDEIAKEHNLSKIMFLIDPLEKDKYKYNYLQKYNYLDASVLNYIIDLDNFSGINDLRKGHAYEIKNILKDPAFSVFFVDQENLSYDLHEEYRLLHHKCSGRITRPKETFDWQFDNLKKGRAVLAGLKYNGNNIAFSYFEYNKEKAAYTSAADDPDYDKMPLYHILIFKAMEYLKNKGVRHIDTEPPSSPSLQFDYYPDKKQLNIALFKSGFGGYYVQNFRGIKYYSDKAFKEDIDNFINNYIKSPLVPFNL